MTELYLAYIGPGAGFAFLGSFLAVIAGAALSVLSLLLWPALEGYWPLPAALRVEPGCVSIRDHITMSTPSGAHRATCAPTDLQVIEGRWPRVSLWSDPAFAEASTSSGTS